ELMNMYGYARAESICNEWNYVKDWGRDYVKSLMVIHGMKGAAFTMGCISASQAGEVDMLMYYDTRPSVFCGAFDLYTYEKLKGYYPLCWYGNFYDMTAEIKAENTLDNVYSLCGVDKDGLITAVITYYSDDDNAGNKKLALDFGRTAKFDVYLLDEDHDGELIAEASENTEFDLKVCSCVMLRERA
ncbi:MAG: hypothetical protein IKZ19_05990, partial [Clostridia bacterium]|nr:hypothetical protein [Clostridia bacterium]